jgi:hypothetical protein
MTVVPEPRQIVRVMVGRIELLTPEREQLAEAAVRSLASPEADKREQAFAFLREQGRYVEPIVGRVLKTTTDENVRLLCRRLILTDFVTELRAAIHNAADGKRLQVDPLVLRAHLARLLREMGLEAAAKAEEKTVMEAMEQVRNALKASTDQPWSKIEQNRQPDESADAARKIVNRSESP